MTHDKTYRIKRISIILSGLLLIGLIYAYAVINFGIGLRCPFEALTGLRCPGCGVSGMCLALLHGDIRGAFACNPLTLCALPFFIFLVGYLGFRYVEFGDQRIPRWMEICVIILIIGYVVFGIARNII